MPGLLKWEELKKLGQEGKIEEANNQIEESLKQYPDYVYYTYYLKGQFLRLFTDQTDEAVECLNKSIEAKNDYAPSYFQLAYVHDTKLKNYEEGRKNYEKCIELNNDHAAAHHNLAILLKSHFNDLDGAAEHYEKTIALKPTALAHCNYGTLLTQQSKFDKAKEQYNKAIELNNDYKNAHKNLANLLSDEFKDYENASKHFEETIRIDPEDSSSYYHYAEALKHQEKYEEAIKNYEICIEKDPNHCVARCNLAILLKKHKKDLEGAEEQYKKCIEVEKENLIYNFNYGLLLKYDLKQIDGAKKQFIRCTEIDAKYVKAFNELGKIAEFQEENYEEARQHFEHALKINEDYKPAKDGIERLDKRAGVAK